MDRAKSMTNATRLRVLNAADYRQSLLDRWPEDWPSKEHHAVQHDIRADQYETLRSLVEQRAGERAIETFLSANREVLSLAVWMFSTGHHMSWIFPKLEVRPPVGADGGLIPDYLLAGASSEGVRWFVLELKGADKAAFVKRGKRVALSLDANNGVCQLLNYIDQSARDQAYLRDGLKLSGFREPQGILLIGTDEETRDSQVANFKQAWNRMNPRLQIRSYSGFARVVANKLSEMGRA